MSRGRKSRENLHAPKTPACFETLCTSGRSSQLLTFLIANKCKTQCNFCHTRRAELNEVEETGLESEQPLPVDARWVWSFLLPAVALIFVNFRQLESDQTDRRWRPDPSRLPVCAWLEETCQSPSMTEEVKCFSLSDNDTKKRIREKT